MGVLTRQVGSNKDAIKFMGSAVSNFMESQS